MPITHVDKRSRIRQLGIFKILFHFLWNIDIRVPTDTLCFLELAKHTGSLDVFEVYIGILRNIHDITEVVVKTLGSMVLFKNLHQLL